MRAMAAGLLMITAVTAAQAQDVVGLEICTAERDMTRRTSCLQSNVNFLQATITKESLAAKRNLDAANRQIEELKRDVADLRRIAVDLQRARDAAKTKVESDKNSK